MPKICYVGKRFNESSLDIIAQANAIIADYEEQGFDLTLRQLYYQFVARDLIANRDSEYKRIGGIINDARLAGLIDWDAIQDRTRELKKNTHWQSPESIIEAAMMSYQRDHWEGQPYRPEVWIEKDALIGVITPVCKALDVPRFSCRGYTSSASAANAVLALRDEDIYEEVLAHEKRDKEQLRAISGNWEDVVDFIKERVIHE